MADSIEVLATLRTAEGEEVTHACSFTADEWQLLERFATYADELSRSKLMATRWDFAFSLRGDMDGVVTFEPTALPDADLFRAFLHYMRPFVLKREATFFDHIRNILGRRLDHPAVRAYLERQKEIFAGRRWQAFILHSNGVVINSTETLDLWLNAYEYHKDADKQEAFEALHDETLPIEYSRALLAGIMFDRARAVIELRNVFRAIEQNRVIDPTPESNEQQP